MAQEFIPDVVLMDLVMPGMDGVEATRKVKNVSPRTQIVILTSFHQDEYIFPALQAGAISYLLKDVKATSFSKPSAAPPGGRPPCIRGSPPASSKHSAAWRLKRQLPSPP